MLVMSDGLGFMLYGTAGLAESSYPDAGPPHVTSRQPQLKTWLPWANVFLLIGYVYPWALRIRFKDLPSPGQPAGYQLIDTASFCHYLVTI